MKLKPLGGVMVTEDDDNGRIATITRSPLSSPLGSVTTAALVSG
jgi:hypothetical protein